MSLRDVNKVTNFEVLEEPKTDRTMKKPQELSRALSSKEEEIKMATVEEFVKRFGGKKVIKRLLIASNGIGAVKCIRSLRRWCIETFNNDKAIFFTAMVTPEDLTANAEYIKLADQHISVPGGDASNNFENPEVVLETAIQCEADAVWLGWGLNGKNTHLPAMLKHNNIAFLGPCQKSLSIFGDKISTLILAQSLNIPTLPWSGVGLKTAFNTNKKFKVPSEMHLQACVNSAEQGMEIALQIKFPVIIMASQSWGPKGFRQVMSPNDFISSFRQMQTEIPDSTILVMKVIPEARHMETQIIADKHANVISLFNRDCSVFRHNRKIIVEGPSTAAMPKVLEEMDKAAVNLAKSAAFVGVGSVEYIYDPNDGQFYFIEFIPQLQIEHPVTEMISKVNLISCQIQIAMEVPLNRIKDIRVLYREKPWEDTIINFEKPTKKPRTLGHVIGARITAENPDDGIKMSSSGTIEEMSFRSTKDAWGYFSFSALSDLMDSQFGHCFAWGENRQLARASLVLALKELQTRGDFQTSIEHLISMSEGNKFLQNNFDAGFLDKVIATKEKEFESTNIMLGIICASIIIADRQITDSFTHFQMALERGHFPPISHLSNVAEVELIHDGLKFNITAAKSGLTSYTLIMNKSLKVVDFNRLNDGGYMLRVEETNHTAHLKEENDSYHIKIGSQSITFQKNMDTSILRSPVHGKLINFLVEDGSSLTKNQPYAEIECETEQITLTSTDTGKITFQKQTGEIIKARSIIGVLELESPSVLKPKDYDGTWGPEEKPYHHDDHIHMLKKYKSILIDCLKGYCLPDAYNETRIIKSFRKFIAYLKTPMLPLCELREALTNISKRIPLQVEHQIRKVMKSYEESIDSVVVTFPREELAFIIDDYASGLNRKSERDSFYIIVQDILKLVQRYRNGFRGYEKEVLNELLSNYYSVESHFKDGMYEKCLLQLCEFYKQDMKAVMNTIYSHSQVKKKNLLVSLVIDELAKADGMTEELEETLKNLTTLNNDLHGKIAMKARKSLITTHKPSYDLRKHQMESILLPAADKYGSSYSTENIKILISSETLIFDILHEFFYHQRQTICKIALEVYVRRVYMPYQISWLQHCAHIVKTSKSPIPAVHFQFITPENHPCHIHKEFSSSFKKRGCIAAVESFENLYDIIDAMLESFDSISGTQSEVSYKYGNSTQSDTEVKKSKEEVINVISMEPIYVINVAIKNCADLEDSQLTRIFVNLFNHHRNEFLNRRIRRISFMALKEKKFPKIFTYRARDNFTEDIIYRNLEPANAFQYELYRLKNYKIECLPTQNRKVHMYLGKGLTKHEKIQDFRIFIRSKVIHSDLISKDAAFGYLTKEGEHSLLEALDEIDLASSHHDYPKCDCNHIFLNFLPCITMSQNEILEVATELIKCYENRLWKMRVLQVEMRFVTHPNVDSEKIAFRVCFSNESGYFLDIAIYEEVNENDVLKFKSVGNQLGLWHGLQVSSPYKTRNHLQQKRLIAFEHDTTYCYDFPDMFRKMSEKLWKEFLNERKSEVIHVPENILQECVELILNSDGKIQDVQRSLGENDIGMTAWRMQLATPEFPHGREFIIIANDITHLNGSMGIEENNFFLKASEYARIRKIPRIFISANSGSRVGFVDEIKAMFKIAWNDPKNSFRGFKYLYLTPDDYSKLPSKNIVQTTHIEDEGESRYKITDIIGEKDGFGVENLRLAAMIANETAKAYDEIVTISMVTSRTVGVGCNIVQLGSRVVQIENSYIITTNFNSINQHLGRAAYTSNTQIGGSRVMSHNGITHKVESTDIDGVYQILKWLSYMPSQHGGELPIVIPSDSIDRQISFTPTKTPYDPRDMLVGNFAEDTWMSGFFDKGSFCEIKKDWARSVVTGRARLCGISVGVIAAETRSFKQKIASDPADEESGEKIVNRSGNILYSDSTLKIARAIADFAREELPLLIFANWLGFSGNLKDTNDGILNFQSEIIEALRNYSKPVFVYLPPHAELRGSAWMTFDSLINPNYIEMYADPETHASVIDPVSMIGMKFKQDELQKLIHRLDSTIIEWSNEIPVDEEHQRNIELNIYNRALSLVPVYRDAVINFATLHHTAKRSHEKGCINDLVPWKSSRMFFYWRLNRLLIENHFVAKICKTYRDISISKAKLMLRRWFMEHKGEASSHHYDSDEKFIKWLVDQKHNKNSIANRNLNDVRKHSIVSEVTNLLEEQPESVLDAVVGLCRNLSPKNLNEVARLLTQLTVESKERKKSIDSIGTDSEHSASSQKSDSIKSIRTI